jgi:hypothetical protein
MHGIIESDYTRPEGRVFITPGSDERVIRMFGTVSGGRITSIGFNTTRGRTFRGPYGSGGGEPFLFDGQVVGFFGAPASGALSGLGVWYTPTVTSTTVPKAIPTYLEMSPAYGNLGSVLRWDDTPNMGGAHQPCLFACVCGCDRD